VLLKFATTGVPGTAAIYPTAMHDHFEVAPLNMKPMFVGIVVEPFEVAGTEQAPVSVLTNVSV
jgi:hypothetical protein